MTGPTSVICPVGLADRNSASSSTSSKRCHQGRRRRATGSATRALPRSDRLPRACEASLARLGVDRLDLSLLHQRYGVLLAGTVDAMERLVEAGRILRWGVSNLDYRRSGGAGRQRRRGERDRPYPLQLIRRGPEYNLLAWLAERSLPPWPTAPLNQVASSLILDYARPPRSSVGRRLRWRWRGCWRRTMSSPSSRRFGQWLVGVSVVAMPSPRSSRSHQSAVMQLCRPL